MLRRHNPMLVSDTKNSYIPSVRIIPLFRITALDFIYIYIYIYLYLHRFAVMRLAGSGALFTGEDSVA